ncbi:hypothetical protein V491_02914, partial [Pseudogymnoascus sp. VKM F-3775]
RSTRAGAAAGTSPRPPSRVPSPDTPGLQGETALSTGSNLRIERAYVGLVGNGDGGDCFVG